MMIVKCNPFITLCLGSIEHFISEHCYIFIPPAYKVYRGYIVFAFSVRMLVCVCVCVSVNFFSVKDFSETT